MDKENFLDRIEKLVSKINNLNYRFADADTQREAVQLIEAATSALEDFSDLVESDTGDEESNDDHS